MHSVDLFGGNSVNNQLSPAVSVMLDNIAGESRCSRKRMGFCASLLIHRFIFVVYCALLITCV